MVSTIAPKVIGELVHFEKLPLFDGVRAARVGHGDSAVERPVDRRDGGVGRR
jgi:hypothetical protein